jgi:hypothetical protein
MNDLLNHYKKEIEVLRSQIPADDQLIIEPFNDKIEEILGIFYKQNYNFAEGSFTLNVLSETIKAALSYRILSPLTGEDSEWGDTLEMNNTKYTPNIRDNGVFKNEDGVVYYNKAIVWIDNTLQQKFTGLVQGVTSQQKIKEFPLMPKTFYIEVELVDYNEKYKEEQIVEVEGEQKVYVIKNKKELEPVFEFYNK